jgi:hypothetical protein
VDVEHVGDHQAMRFHGAPMIQCCVFVCTTTLRMCAVPTFKMLRGCSGIPIIHTTRNEEVYVWLMLCATQREWVMDGIRTGKAVTGNHRNQILDKIEVLLAREFVREGDFPLLKRNATPLVIVERLSFIVLSGHKEILGSFRPGREIMRAFRHKILAPMTEVRHLRLGMR